MQAQLLLARLLDPGFFCWPVLPNIGFVSGLSCCSMTSWRIRTRENVGQFACGEGVDVAFMGCFDP
jgi:hypothetical protein